VVWGSAKRGSDLPVVVAALSPILRLRPRTAVNAHAADRVADACKCDSTQRPAVSLLVERQAAGRLWLKGKEQEVAFDDGGCDVVEFAAVVL
jgi:hypothetical protein